MNNTLMAAIAATALLVGLPQHASAAVITADLNVISSPGIGSGTLGTVTVTDISGGVTVNVALNSGYKFVETGGPHTAFAFNLDRSFSTITDIQPSVYSVASGPQQATPYGTFAVGLECTTCKNGNAGSVAGPLGFRVNGVTTINFTANSLGYIFAADLVNTSNGSTGSVANGAITMPPVTTPPVTVPEPASMALFGAGLLGLGAVRRRRVQA